MAARTKPVAWRFDAATHTYWLGDEPVPSVTGILRAAYPPSRPYPEGSGDRGTRIHLLTAQIDYGMTPKVSPEDAGFVRAYEAFLRAHRPGYEEIERPRISRRYRFGGTPDRLGELNGRPLVLDIKTGAEEDWHGAQTAAQDILWSNAGSDHRGIANLLRMTLHLKANGQYRVKVWSEAEDYDRWWRAWDAHRRKEG